MKEILENFNDQSAQNSFTQADVQKNNILAAVCYVFPILFFVPILGIVMAIIGIIPVLGAIIDVLISLCMLALLIALVYGAVKGMAVRIPFIGNFINVF